MFWLLETPFIVAFGVRMSEKLEWFIAAVSQHVVDSQNTETVLSDSKEGYLETLTVVIEGPIRRLYGREMGLLHSNRIVIMFYKLDIIEPSYKPGCSIL